MTINGTNDVPVITSGAADAGGTVTEAGQLDDGTFVPGTDTTSGTLNSTDIDTGATATWSVSGAGNYGAIVIDPSTGEWTYTLDNSLPATQALQEGQSGTETFTAMVTDDNGAVATQLITITVNGTNDGPSISGDSGSVTEDAAAILTTGGDLNLFVGPDDVSQSFTISPQDTGYFGNLTVNPDGTWDFAVDTTIAAVQELAPGETVVQTYDVTVTDDKGAFDTETVTVTIVGTNDAPSITADAGTVTEDAAPVLTTGGDLNLTAGADDVAQTLTFAPQAPGYLGTLNVNPDGTWDFSVDNSLPAIQQLAPGDSIVQVYDVTVDDGQGGTLVKPITVTIQGTNDAPSITADFGILVEDAAPVLTTSGDLNLTPGVDDITQTLSVSPQAPDYLGDLTVNPDGTWDFSVDTTLPEIQYLAPGESLVQTYNVTVDDGQGGTMTQPITIVIQGTEDLPSIGIPESSSVHENDLPAGSDTTKEPVQVSGSLDSAYGGDGVGEMAFDSIQSGLNGLGLTSGGQPLIYSVSGDGSTVTATAGIGGSSVFQVVLSNVNEPGTYTFTLLEPLDHTGSNLEFVDLPFDFKVSDRDGDVVSDTFSVRVEDDVPLAADYTSSPVEGTSAAGNVFTDSAAGQAGADNGEIVDVTFGGTTLAVSSGSPAVFDTPNGTMTVSVDGSWTFVTDPALDHDAPGFVPTETFSYTLEDRDGDTASGEVAITAVDGAAPTAENAVLGIVEPVLGNTQTAFVDFDLTQGSDPLVLSTVQFSPGVIGIMGAKNYASDGTPLQYTLSADGQTLYAGTAVPQPDGSVPGGNLVFSLTLTPNVTGTGATVRADMTLSAPVDHIDAGLEDNVLDMPLTVSVQDHDGTSLLTPLDLDVTLTDGVLPQLSVQSGISLDEQGFDFSTGDLTGTGSFALTTGSDSIAFTGFSPAGDQPALSSNGENLQYQVSGDGQTLTASTPGGVEVFVVAIQPGAGADIFDYEITLKQPIDQVGADVSNLTKDLALQVETVDADGDRVLQALEIDVKDGISPTLTMIDGDVVVTELPDANPADTITDTDTGTFAVQAGSDALTSISFGMADGTPVLDANGDPVTHQGNALSYQSNLDGTVTGVTGGGTQVFTLTLVDADSAIASGGGNVSYELTLHQEVDHLTTDSLSLPISFVVTDTDNTQETLDASISLLDGAVPTLGAVDDMYAKESGLNSGSSPRWSDRNDSGNVDIVEGSDGVFLSLDKAFFDAQGLTSNGAPVVLDTNPAGNGWWRARADVNGNGNANEEILRIRVRDNGTYQIRFTRPLDHPDGAGENELSFDFQINGVDFDQDSVTPQTVTVTVLDDVVAALDDADSVVEGNVVSGNVFSNDTPSADGFSLTTFTYTDDNGVLQTANAGQTVQLESGSFVLNDNGTWTFTSTDGVDHASPIVESITYTILDNDGDTASADLVIDVQDQPVTLSTAAAAGVEDQGIDLTLAVDFGDVDQGESVSSLTLTGMPPGSSLFLNGVALTPAVVGNTVSFAVPVSAVGGDGTITGLTYIAPADVSSATDTIAIGVEAAIADAGGDQAAVLTGTIPVTVRGEADAPDLVVQADGTGLEDTALPLDIQASLTDLDGSESLALQIEGVPDGAVLSAGQDLGGGVWSVTQADLAGITLTPPLDFSGEIALTVRATSTESSPLVGGSEAAERLATITLDVAPQADDPTLATRDIRGVEDNAVALDAYIRVQNTDTSSDSVDLAETQTLRISGLPTGAQLLLGGMAVGQEPDGSYLVQGASLDQLTLVPPEDSNEDFVFQVSARSTDTTDGVTDTGGWLPDQDIRVTLTGDADAPLIIPNAGNAENWTLTGGVLTAVVPEDSLVRLDLTVASGEDLGALAADGSETLNIIIQGLSDDIELVRSDGTPAPVTYVGVGGDGTPLWQVGPDQIDQVYAHVPDDFSGDIAFSMKVVATENDGDRELASQPGLIRVLPIVDTPVDPGFTASGLEDSLIDLDWRPTLNDLDGSETITGARLEGFPEDAVLHYQDGAGDWQPLVRPADGIYDLTQVTDGAGNTLDVLGRPLAVLPPTDSDAEMTGTVAVDILDTSTAGTDAVTQNGTFVVNVRAVVETDTELQVVDPDIDPVSSTTGNPVLSEVEGTPLDLEPHVRITNNDINSVETAEYFIIAGLDPGWVVDGGVQNGDGTWTVVAENLAGVSIAPPSGFTGTLEGVQIGSRILDNDSQPVDQIRTLDLTVTPDAGGGPGGGGPGGGGPGGGGGSGDPDVPSTLQATAVDGDEDAPAPVSGHLDSLDNIVGADEVGVVRIDAADIPAGVTLQGDNIIYNFLTDSYILTQDGLDTLRIDPPADYAGAVGIPITVVATNAAGNSASSAQTLQVEFTPVADRPGLDVDIQNSFEDSVVEIDLQSLVGDSDQVNGTETIDSMIIGNLSGGSLSAPPGVLQDNGDGTYTVLNPQALAMLHFTPPADAHGDYSFDVTTTVSDVAGSATDTASFVNTVNVDIVSQTDPALVTVQDAVGDEDTAIPLTGLDAQLVDVDGSEIISVVVAGVPDGALLSHGFDNGDGTWTVPQSDLGVLAMTPPADFSGSIDLNLVAYTRDTGQTDFVETMESFTVTVNPVADELAQAVDVEAVSAGREDSLLPLDLELSTTDTDGSETIRVVVHGVPATASVLLPAGVPGAVQDLGGGNWEVTVDQGTLDQLLVDPGDAFGEHALSVDAYGVDGASGTPVPVVTDITLDIEPVADGPTLDVAVDAVQAGTGATIPLDIDAQLVAPAPGEILSVQISGVPDGATLNNGTQTGPGQWTVPGDELGGLELALGTTPAGNYSLDVTATASLDGEQANTTIAGAMDVQVTDQPEIDGDAGDNVLMGGTAGEEISGGGGLDILNGGGGDDILLGGTGNDQLTGGAGDDVMQYTAQGGEGDDLVTDFTLGEDAIQLTDVLDEDGNSVSDLADLLTGSGSQELEAQANGADVELTISGPSGDTNVTLVGLNAGGNFDTVGENELQQIIDVATNPNP
ncbi:T1SS-143 repeat domain-containing protein [Desulfoplanes sp.]